MAKERTLLKRPSFIPCSLLQCLLGVLVCTSARASHIAYFELTVFLRTLLCNRRQRPAQSSGDLRRRDQSTVTAAPHPLRESDLVLLTAFVRTAGEVRRGSLVGLSCSANRLMLVVLAGRRHNYLSVHAYLKNIFPFFTDSLWGGLFTVMVGVGTSIDGAALNRSQYST